MEPLVPVGNGVDCAIVKKKKTISNSSHLITLTFKLTPMGEVLTDLSFHVYVWIAQLLLCPVGWGCRIHRLLLWRRVRPPPNECPWYDTKQSDGEVLAVLELWGMRSTPSLLLLPGPLCPGVVAPERALSMG